MKDGVFQRSKLGKKPKSVKHIPNKTSEGESKRRNGHRITMPPETFVNVTHFLCHIPKAGAEYATDVLNSLQMATIPLPRNLDLGSIRKAQAAYDRSLRQKNSSASYFSTESTDHDHSNPKSRAYAPPFICNSGVRPLRYLHHFFLYPPQRMIKFRCSFWTTEAPYLSQGIRGNPVAKNVYTIVREPISHVLSQYFHCTESVDHSRLRSRSTGNLLNHHQKMPSLNVWLANYAKIARSIPLDEISPFELKGLKRIMELRNRFRCYNPIDSQSAYVQFPPMNKNATSGEQTMLVLPKDYTYPYFDSTDWNGQRPEHDDRDEASKQLDRQLFDDLKKRFRVIGDTAQMTKTICAIFIDYSEGKHIPALCDCSQTVDGNTTSNDKSFQIRNLYFKPDSQLVFRGLSRNITIGYDAEKHSHGVKHHGSSFAKTNLTSVQKNVIENFLRKRDLILYNVSRAVFAEQVREMEVSYGIKLCNQWNRPPREGGDD